MSAYVTVKNLTRIFDVSKPWLNRVIERRKKAFLHAVFDVSFNIEEKTFDIAQCTESESKEERG